MFMSHAVVFFVDELECGRTVATLAWHKRLSLYPKI